MHERGTCVTRVRRRHESGGFFASAWLGGASELTPTLFRFGSAILQNETKMKKIMREEEEE